MSKLSMASLMMCLFFGSSSLWSTDIFTQMSKAEMQRKNREHIGLVLRTTQVEYEGRSPLHEAARKGEVSNVVYLIKNRGKDPNEKDVFGNTPILYAESSFESIKALAENGAFVNQTNSNSSTILHQVCGLSPADPPYFAGTSEEKVFKMVRYLLSKHAAVNTQDFVGFTPLHDAARHNRPRLTKLLLENGAVIAKKTFGSGCTPLHEAADEGAVEVAELLVQAGADKSIVTNYGKTAFDVANAGHNYKVHSLPTDKKTRLLDLLRVSLEE